MKTLTYNHGKGFPNRQITVSDEVIEYVKRNCDYDEDIMEEFYKHHKSCGRMLYYGILRAMCEGYTPTVCELDLIIQRVSVNSLRMDESEKRRDGRMFAIYN